MKLYNSALEWTYEAISYDAETIAAAQLSR